ncbi:MAG TPA: AAA family ATPase, partial [Tahibacter sp.]|nr:AAA family ATPase [Tahibacter sp.]
MSTASLNRIVLKGFRSIREMDIELKPINLLIGANGAGKSNFLSIFGFLRELARRNLQFHTAQRGGADKILHFGRKATQSLEISLDFSDCRYYASLVGTDDDRFQFSFERIDEDNRVSPDDEQAADMLKS